MITEYSRNHGCFCGSEIVGRGTNCMTVSVTRCASPDDPELDNINTLRDALRKKQQPAGGTKVERRSKLTLTLKAPSFQPLNLRVRTLLST